MPEKLNATVAAVGIDIGKYSFHVVGLDQCGAIVLRQKWSRSQLGSRFANMPPCLVVTRRAPKAGDRRANLGADAGSKIGRRVTLRRELAIEKVRRQGSREAIAFILRQPAPARSGPQSLSPHQAFDLMQPAGDAFAQHVTPDTAGPVGPVAGEKARPHPGADLLVSSRPLARPPCQPGMEARTRDPERLAHPPHRPDSSVLRDESELHSASLAK